MRILVVNWRDIRHPEAGGAEVHFHETFTRVAAAGHEVTLLCTAFAGAPERERIDGIDIVRNGGKFTFNLSVPHFYRKHLDSRDFDVIVEDLNKIPFFLPWFTRRPILALVHHLFGTAVFRETNPLFAVYVYLAERLIPHVYRQCPFEVVPESTRDELVDMGIAASQISVVHNGTEIPAFEERLAKTPGQVIYVGRIKRYKNVDRLLRAMVLVRRSLPEARLVVVGEGDQRVPLQRLAQKLGLGPAVEFTGFVPDAEKYHHLRASQVAAFPSDKEGWGLSVIEAAACRTPVVATDVPGLRDAVVDGETGILLPLGDTQALAARLVEMLQNDTLRERMAASAAARAADFTWERTAERTLEVLEAVAGASRRGTPVGPSE